MEDIASLFREHGEHFTIYVVEQRFVVEKGREFFKRYQGCPNYIDNDYSAKQFLSKIYKWIGSKIPIIETLLSIAFRKVSVANIGDIIMAFSKLYVTQCHQAAGPDVIDPIIIQEGKVTIQNINHIVAIHKESILAPAIIIMLQDNNFDRAKEMLSECPDGICVKFIRNNGNTELHRVINTGAQDIEVFMDAFSKQCFSTCSNTPRNILLNSEWDNDPIIKKYAFNLLQFRSNLICDEKTDILVSLNACINELEADLKGDTSVHDRILMENFLCISKLFRVFCNDNGGQDIGDALSLAKNLNNNILEANVYKYAFFLPKKSIEVQNELLDKAYNIYSQNGMRDNAIYCKNNQLIRQFDEGKIQSRRFDDLVGEATGDVPGLVGMAHIYNNAGLAHMMTGKPEEALVYFNQGLTCSKASERFVQRMALECNKMILNTYYKSSIVSA